MFASVSRAFVGLLLLAGLLVWLGVSLKEQEVGPFHILPTPTPLPTPTAAPPPTPTPIPTVAPNARARRLAVKGAGGLPFAEGDFHAEDAYPYSANVVLPTCPATTGDPPVANAEYWAFAQEASRRQPHSVHFVVDGQTFGLNMMPAFTRALDPDEPDGNLALTFQTGGNAYAVWQSDYALDCALLGGTVAHIDP